MPAKNPRAAFPKGCLKDSRSSFSRMLTGVSAKGTWPRVFCSEFCGKDAVQRAGRRLTCSLGLLPGAAGRQGLRGLQFPGWTCVPGVMAAP